MKKYLINLVIAIVIVISNMSMSFGQETVKVVYYDRPPFHYGNNEGIMFDMLKYVLKDYNLDIVKAGSQDETLSAIQTGEFQIGMGFPLTLLFDLGPGVEMITEYSGEDPMVIWEGGVIPINNKKYTSIRNMPYMKTYAQIIGTSDVNEIVSPRYKLIETNSAEVIFKRMNSLRYDFTWFGYYEGLSIAKRLNLRHVYPSGSEVGTTGLHYIVNIKTSLPIFEVVNNKLINLKQYEKIRYNSIQDASLHSFLDNYINGESR